MISKERFIDQLEGLGDKRDKKDAEIVFKIFKALKSLKDDKVCEKVVNRTARETIQQVWQQPRLPKEKYSHNKPYKFPWSEAAKELLDEDSAKGKLVLEHSMEMIKYTNELFDEIGKNIDSVNKMLMYLIKTHNYYGFAIITNKEHKDLTSGITEPTKRYEGINFVSAEDMNEYALEQKKSK